MTARTDVVALHRLAALVAGRRLSLGMDKIDVARAADLTITTYSKIERGESVRDTSYGKLEPVLGWAPRSCLEILNGADHAPLITGQAATSLVVGDLADDIADAVQDAAIHVSDSMTASEIRNLKAQVLQFLRDRGKLPPLPETGSAPASESTPSGA